MKTLFSRRSIFTFLFLAVLAYLGLYYFQLAKPQNIGKISLYPIDKAYSLRASIGDSQGFLMLDTGATDHIDLSPAAIEKIGVSEPIGTFTWYDVNNNKYVSDVFQSKSDIHFDKFVVHKPTVKLEQEDFLNKGSSIKGPPNPTRARNTHLSNMGSINATTLRAGKYWLLDLKEPSLWFIKDLSKAFSRNEISREDFIEVDLLKNFEHLVVSVQTDFGVKKFAIDTGAEVSSLSPTGANTKVEFINSESFVMSGYDFGSQSMLTFSIFGENFDAFDGFIGLDFLEKHRIIFDFEKNKAYISRD